jgi:putative sterol carrier protein
MPDEEIQPLMHRLAQALAEGERSRRIAIQFHLYGEMEEDWSVVVEAGHCSLIQEAVAEPDVTIIVDREDFVKMMTGQLEEVGWSFMQGSLVVCGDASVLWRALLSASGDKAGE